MEGSTKEEQIQEETKNGGVSDEEDSSSQKRSKHTKKHKHKHSKKHKHKHKKRKHKRKSSSRSRSRSSSHSRSRSPDNAINSDNDSNLDPCLETYDVASFKLEKSVSRSPSPNSKRGLKKSDDTDVLKSTFCPKDDAESKIKAGSESPPFYTEQDLLERDGKLPISKASSAAEDAVDNSDTKMNLESQCETKSSTLNGNEKNSKPNTVSVLDSAGAIKIESRKSKSKSPMDSKKRSRSKSRSLSPKSRKRNHSKSRSKSPKSKHNRKSRSRSRSYEKRKSRRKSRSRSLSSKSQSRSPRRDRSKDRKRSRSKDRRRSKSKDRRRSRSKDRSKGRDKRRSRSRDGRKSKSPVRGSRDSSRKEYRSSSYDRRRSRRNSSYRRSPSPRRRPSRRSRSRTPQRRNRGRSRSPSRRGYRNRSRSKSRSRRSRSRSYSSRKRKSRTRSRSKSRDRSKKRSRSKSVESNSDKKSSASTATSSTSTTAAKDLVGKAPTVSDPSNKKSLAMLTEFCKKLTEARGIADNNEKEKNESETKEEEEEEEGAISHPFLVAPKKDITIPQVIFPVKPFLPPVNMIDSSKPLTEQFPVSCGTKHHEKESEDTSHATIPDVNGSATAVQHPQPVFHQPQIQEKLDISSLVVKRMDAQRRLQANPNDVDAMLALQEIEMKLNNWCQSNVKPGQFTGQLAKQMMPKEKMNAGYQAWAKKDMFHNLNPVSGGVGMKLLQKMGWAPGQVLGKSGKGMVEPIALTVKVDRKGLSSTMERPLGKKGGSVVPNLNNKAQLDLQGKHPISMLQEFCARRKWNIPEFTLIFDEGPPHSKQFLFKVLVNGYEYQNPVVSGNKKHAKAQAAVAALKGLGLVPEDAQF